MFAQHFLGGDDRELFAYWRKARCSGDESWILMIFPFFFRHFKPNITAPSSSRRYCSWPDMDKSFCCGMQSSSNVEGTKINIRIPPQGYAFGVPLYVSWINDLASFFFDLAVWTNIIFTDLFDPWNGLMTRSIRMGFALLLLRLTHRDLHDRWRDCHSIMLLSVTSLQLGFHTTSEYTGMLPNILQHVNCIVSHWTKVQYISE